MLFPSPNSAWQYNLWKSYFLNKEVQKILYVSIKIRKMYIEIFIIVLLLAAVGVGLWALIRSYQIEKFKDTPAFQKQMKEEEKKEAKNCCAGCSKCPKYTAAAVATMEEEGRSVPIGPIVGTIVDMRCYSQNICNFTDKHITAIGGTMDRCGEFCATRGIPVGLLVNGKPGSRVYILLTSSRDLSKKMEKEARVTGRLMKDSGGLYTIKIEFKNKKGEWEDTNIKTPM